MVTCSTCPFWFKYESSGMDGECRFDAPRHIIQSNRGQSRAVWPLTVESEFCFEHPQLKEQKYSVNICESEGSEDALGNRQSTV